MARLLLSVTGEAGRRLVEVTATELLVDSLESSEEEEEEEDAVDDEEADADFLGLFCNTLQDAELEVCFHTIVAMKDFVQRTGSDEVNLFQQLVPGVLVKIEQIAAGPGKGSGRHRHLRRVDRE